MNSQNAANLATKRRSPQRSSPTIYINQNTYNIKAIKDQNLNNQNINTKIEYMKQESYQKQLGLKKILRDFGLQQYLRVYFILFRNFMNLAMTIIIFKSWL